MSENEPARDSDVEAQWHDEIANALEEATRHHRRLAGLLRIAGGALPAAQLYGQRLDARRATYRLIEILKRIDELTGGSVGP